MNDRKPAEWIVQSQMRVVILQASTTGGYQLCNYYIGRIHRQKDEGKKMTRANIKRLTGPKKLVIHLCCVVRIWPAAATVATTAKETMGKLVSDSRFQ